MRGLVVLSMGDRSRRSLAAVGSLLMLEICQGQNARTRVGNYMRDERGAFREASGTSQGTNNGQGSGEGKGVVKNEEHRWVKSVVESVVEFFARTRPAPDARNKNS